MTRLSPFFHKADTASADSLVILQLKRDNLLPVTLSTTGNEGYIEGAVVNTRYGSFPHTTLIGSRWGSQVKASRVDTGSRARRSKKAVVGSSLPQPDQSVEINGKRKASDELPFDDIAFKRKKLDDDHVSTSSETSRIPAEAGSGFTHILAPTPETWTTSLSHRTQVVYVPDYSYVLTRLCVKPGEILIEAGAGSGSFTHAAARAVFNGYPSSSMDEAYGRIYSYEYHEPRAETLRQELDEHGLESIVTLTHRDVCMDGFSLSPDAPKATAIFLDLPAPWQALQHLTRTAPDSPLSPEAPIRICTFSPCIEQVTATVAALRTAGWVEIRMTEVQNRRIEVRRERIGFQEAGLRGVHAMASSVEESVTRLREVEAKLKEFHGTKDSEGQHIKTPKSTMSKAARLAQNQKQVASRALYKEGRLIHRIENEIKTHTSYLVFAILPRQWTDEDEATCAAQWSTSKKS